MSKILYEFVKDFLACEGLARGLSGSKINDLMSKLHADMSVDSYKEIRNKIEKSLKKMGAKYLGQGASRIVYAISPKRVLKLARIPREIGQNQLEVSMWTRKISHETRQFFPEVYAASDDYTWIVSELVKPLENYKFEDLTKRFQSLKGLENFLDMYDLFDMILEYQNYKNFNPSFFEFSDDLFRNILARGSSDGSSDSFFSKSEKTSLKAAYHEFVLPLLQAAKESGIKDLHPGNYGVGSDGRLVFLDPGIFDVMSRQGQEAYLGIDTRFIRHGEDIALKRKADSSARRRARKNQASAPGSRGSPGM